MDAATLSSAFPPEEQRSSSAHAVSFWLRTRPFSYPPRVLTCPAAWTPEQTNVHAQTSSVTHSCHRGDLLSPSTPFLHKRQRTRIQWRMAYTQRCAQRSSLRMTHSRILWLVTVRAPSEGQPPCDAQRNKSGCIPILYPCRAARVWPQHPRVLRPFLFP